MASAADIAAMLGGIKNGSRWLARCPVASHGQGRGDKSRSLSLADGRSGKLLVKCFAGCDPVDILKALPGGRYQPPSAEDLAAAQERAEKKAAQNKAAAIEIWRRSKNAERTIVERYLRSRGIKIPIPRSLRFAMCRIDGVMRPAMIAAAQGADGHVIGIQRTFLTDDAEKIMRKQLGLMYGGAIRLAATGPDVTLCEGTETGLAYMQMHGTAAWACAGTENLVSTILPTWITGGIIAADHDPPGIRAARKAQRAQRRQGRAFVVRYPRRRGDDFADEVMAR